MALQVDPVVVADAGGEANVAGQIATAPPPAGIRPAANDPVSVGVAYAIAAQMNHIDTQSALGSGAAMGAGALLGSNAQTYSRQEHANALGLASTSGSVAAVALDAPAMPTVPASAPAPNVPMAAVPPTSGNAIAKLIHSGSGGASIQTAADRMRAHASDLQISGDQLRASADTVSSGWDSDAGTQAHIRISGLSSWFDSHSEAAASTATGADRHLENFARARNAIPPPEEFDELENRIAAADRANRAAGGLYAPVVAELQTQYAALNRRAMTGYGDYAESSGIQLVDFSTDMPPQVPPPPRNLLHPPRRPHHLCRVSRSSFRHQPARHR